MKITRETDVSEGQGKSALRGPVSKRERRCRCSLAQACRNQLMESTNKRKAAEMQSDEEASAKLKRVRGRALKQTSREPRQFGSTSLAGMTRPPQSSQLEYLAAATRGTGAAKARTSAENEGRPKSARNGTQQERESRLFRERARGDER